jgi:hypothetical protein
LINPLYPPFLGDLIYAGGHPQSPGRKYPAPPFHQSLYYMALTVRDPWSMLSTITGSRYTTTVHPSLIDSRNNGGDMGDILAFRKMITPIIIKIVFWIGLTVILVLGIVAIVDGISNDSDVGEVIAAGVLILILGPIIWRVFCEILLLTFRIIENLADIRNIIKGKKDGDKSSVEPN